VTDRLERVSLVAVGVALAVAWVQFRIDLNGATADYRVFDLAARHWLAPYDKSVYLSLGTAPAHRTWPRRCSPSSWWCSSPPCR
jgi:hypothetical protein